LNEALLSARTAQDDAEIARALRTLALSAYRQSRYHDAEDLLKGTDDLAIRANDLYNYVDILYLRGNIEFMEEKYQEAKSTLNLMLQISEKLKWERAKAYAFNQLGELAVLEGDFVRAKEMLESGLTIASSYGDRREVARLQMALANLNIYKGSHSKALELAYQADDTFKRLGMWNEGEEIQAILHILNRKPYWLSRLMSRFTKPQVRYTGKPIGGD